MTEILLAFLFPLTFIFAALYFIFLHRFGGRLRSENPSAWQNLNAKLKIPRMEIQVTYLALQKSKNGILCDESLAVDVLKSRRLAMIFLYLTMFFFLVLLCCILFP